MLYPQNGDRIVAMDTVTSLHPICTGAWLSLSEAAFTADEPNGAADRELQLGSGSVRLL